MNIFEETKKLNFPLGSYVVVGSGHLIALGLKEGTDIDIVVTKNIFEKCKEEGWETIPWTYPGTEGEIFLRKGFIELYLSVSCKNTPPSNELIHNAVIIGGVPFATLDDILKLKREYSKTKPKHLKDINLVETYLKNNKGS